MQDSLTANADPYHMTCMEVWGGNQVVDTAVTLAGLDAWVYSKPYAGADEGGDVHYLSSCATGRITRLLVADVSGHGQAVSATAAQLRALMRRYVNHIDQRRFVQSMNEQFSELSDAGTFATALVSTYFAPTGILSLCNAGHPPPLAFYNGKWSVLDAEEKEALNIPLGIEGAVQYEQFDTRLEMGDCVVCYTDSLIECFEADRTMLGVNGLLKVIQTMDNGEPATFIPKLLEKITALHPENLKNDDVTVLLFRATSHSPTVSFKERLIAKGKMMTAIFRHGEAWPEWSIANIGGAIFSPLSRRWHGTSKRS